MCGCGVAALVASTALGSSCSPAEVGGAVVSPICGHIVKELFRGKNLFAIEGKTTHLPSMGNSRFSCCHQNNACSPQAIWGGLEVTVDEP